jgi:hypothetical protein
MMVIPKEMAPFELKEAFANEKGGRRTKDRDRYCGVDHSTVQCLRLHFFSWHLLSLPCITSNFLPEVVVMLLQQLRCPTQDEKRRTKVGDMRWMRI